MHARMVNLMFTDRQQPVSPMRHTMFMDEVWKRIDEELLRRRRDWQWLYSSLGFDRQRVNNWKRRRVPPEAYQPIADLLEKSLDWVARGLDTDFPHAFEGPESQNAKTHEARMTAYRYGAKKPLRAPVIEWARLGVDLHMPSSEVKADEYIIVPDDASDFCKWVELDKDYPSFRLRRGSKIAIDPILDRHTPEDGRLYVFKNAAGKFLLAEYRSLANDSFEAIPHDGPPMDRDRHGLALVAIVRGTWL